MPGAAGGAEADLVISCQFDKVFLMDQFWRFFSSFQHLQYDYDKILLMTRFELQTTGIGNNRSANLATATAHLVLYLFYCVISFDDECLGEHTYNGEETDGNRTFSEGEGDTSKATDTEMASPKKEKKKKGSGLRTPSFLKKKKKDKKTEKA